MYTKKFDNEFEALPFLAEGNLAAFNFIYIKYSDLIYSNICKYVKNVSFAEDILQEVFLALWENRTTIKTDTSVAGWLFTVSYNKSIGVLKKQLKDQMFMTETQNLHSSHFLVLENEEIEYQNKVSLLEEAVKCLPAKKQEVYRLSKFENMKPEEISAELGLTVISVKHYIKQSTKQVKQYVQLKYPALIIVLFIFLLEAPLTIFFLLR